MIIKTDQKILMMLFEKGELNYRRICDGRIHPKIARRELDKLVRNGFVREKGGGKSWKRGKKKFYSLTAKGVEQLAKITRDDFNGVLRRIQKIISIYARDPAKLRHQIITAWKASLIRPFKVESSEWRNLDDWDKEVLRTTSYTAEEIDEEALRIEKIFEPFLDCLKIFYKLFLIADNTDLYSKIYGNQDAPHEIQEVVMGFTKGGYPYFIPVWRLKSHGIHPPTL